MRTRIEEMLSEHAHDVAEARKRSVDQSRHTLKGRITEQMAPLLPGFEYEASDARFLGDPVDYVVFSGYTNLRDNAGDGDELEVVLLEVKQGVSALTPYQKAIAGAFKTGRVRFEVCRVNAEGKVSTKQWPLRIATKSVETG